MDNFLSKLNDFFTEFNISSEVKDREAKHYEEVCEYIEAVQTSTREHADDEAIDMFITATALCKARGINNILTMAGLKLERASDRYRKQNLDKQKFI